MGGLCRRVAMRDHLGRRGFSGSLSMTHTAYTAELSADWDLQLDGNGNVAMIRGASAIVQNVCNEGRLFYNDAVFRWDHGVHWFSDQIAQPIQEAITTEDLRSAALSVPGVLTVESVQLKALDATTRVLSADVQITTEGGTYGTARI